MDPNPNTFPILSYVMSKYPSQTPPPPPPSDQTSPHSDLTDRMPRLTDPAVLSSMRSSVSEVAQTRSVLQTLGPRPDREAVHVAKHELTQIDVKLSKQLEEIVLETRPSDIERLKWRGHVAERERECREAAERERRVYKAEVAVEEMHRAYEEMLRGAEERLERIYEGGDVAEEEEAAAAGGLREGEMGVERVDLSGRRLRWVPEAFGRLRGLVALNLSSNQLEVSRSE